MTTLSRWQAYIIIKNILCRYGAIPLTEEQFEKMIGELLELIAKK